MTDTDNHKANDPPNSGSLVKPRMGQRIAEILDVAAKDRTAGIQQARRLRAWLRQKATGQAIPDIQEVLKELDLLIDILRNEK